MDAFTSPQTLYDEILNQGYIIDYNFALTIWVSYKLDKPLLLSGLPGNGKTEIANILAKIISQSDPIRLQCYEGIDENKAIFDFDYRKQLLYIEATRGSKEFDEMEKTIYSEEFLIARPLLKSIISDKQTVLLIDEIDKADEEFEPLLLEILSSFQVSIPEIGTIKAKTKPFVILTSNDNRELSDALKRRCCFYYIDLPSFKKEVEIVRTHVPEIDSVLLNQVVTFVQLLRKESLKKIPSISETIDWARTLINLNINNIDSKVVASTLNLLLKNQNDLKYVTTQSGNLIKQLPSTPVTIDRNIVAKQKQTTTNTKKIDKKEIWDF